MTSTVLLTGATGFLGSRLAVDLESKPDVILTSAVRRYVDVCGEHVVEVRSLDAKTDWSVALKNQKVVIHTAARAHIMKDEIGDSLAEYRRINVSGTLSLAEQAAAAGVKRFVFISSVKVNGEQTSLKQPFNDLSIPLPEDDYGLSKWEAEQKLMQLADETGMEVVIIRPPLVYGPSAKGNFASVCKLIKKEYPLPFASITKNKRSLIALENLVNFILLCADSSKTPQAANETFLISDGEDVSTAELFNLVAKAYSKKNPLFPFPVSLLRLGAKLLGKKGVADRLLGSLQVDSSKARELLGWSPVITMQEQLKKMAEADKLASKNN